MIAGWLITKGIVLPDDFIAIFQAWGHCALVLLDRRADWRAVSNWIKFPANVAPFICTTGTMYAPRSRDADL